jgi:hypothetical protein
MPDELPNGKALDALIQTFDRWLILEDKTPLFAVLGAIAANYLPGDPVWLGIIAPPSSAKTEILNALSTLPDVRHVATLTAPALLSGTPKKEHLKGAHGGLLREIGKFGILVIKDFGSILTLRPDTKAEVIAALREVYDGHWTRIVGSEGGRALHWSGKIGVVFASTETYDDHYSVSAGLGERNLLCRLNGGHAGQLQMALRHAGAETPVMRTQLADAVRRLFSTTFHEPEPLSDDEIASLERAVEIVIRLRGHVNRDWRTREIESVHAPEGPARLTLALERLRAGLCGIGLNKIKALDVAIRVAFDTAPPARVAAFNLLSSSPQSTRDLATKLALPTKTVRRTLEDLMCQHLAIRHRDLDEFGDEKLSGADLWEIQYPSP